MQVARDNSPFEGIPYGDAATAFIRSRIPNNAREVKTARTATQPPLDTAAAGLLLTADRLLGRDGQAELLNDLAQAAASREPEMWASTQYSTQASDGLKEKFIRHRKGLTQSSRIRAYTNGRLFTFHPAHVPAYLDGDTFHRHFADVRGPSNTQNRSRYERSLRRYVPIALVMLVTDFDTTAAGTLLGYDKPHIFAGTARASKAFRDLGEPELLRRITAIAAELEAAPRINWQSRRGWFKPDWTIYEDDWAELQQALPRKDTPWERCRVPFTTWIWALVTGGDIKDAPMIQTVINGRICTGGASRETSELIRRTGPALHEYVRDLAERIAAAIDEG